jgi:hypothetical protein
MHILAADGPTRLQTTPRDVEGDFDAKRKLVQLV